MAEAGQAIQSSEAELERAQLEEIDSCIHALDFLQKRFLRDVSQGDLEKAQGRKCILGVTDLKYHKYAKFFEVTPHGVALVPPYREFNSYIAAPVDSVLRVLKGVLDGDTSAFASEWARGKARIEGERKLHDGYVFQSIFARLAAVIRRYKQG